MTDTDVTIEGMRVSEALQRMVLAKLKDVTAENDQWRETVKQYREEIDQAHADAERERQYRSDLEAIYTDVLADRDELRDQIERLRTENDERARETERVLAKLKDVAIENERLRAQAEIDNICIEILEKKNDELRTALVYWKPSQCGTIYPYPVAGEVVKYCTREHGHGGAHHTWTNEAWV